MTQDWAKSFLPPGASIWRANTRGGWHSHLPPHRRQSCSWKEHDMNSFRAYSALLRRVWELYLADNDMSAAQCPIKGVFGDDSAAPAALA